MPSRIQRSPPADKKQYCRGISDPKLDSEQPLKKKKRKTNRHVYCKANPNRENLETT